VRNGNHCLKSEVFRGLPAIDMTCPIMPGHYSNPICRGGEVPGVGWRTITTVFGRGLLDIAHGSPLAGFNAG